MPLAERKRKGTLQHAFAVFRSCLPSKDNPENMLGIRMYNRKQSDISNRMRYSGPRADGAAASHGGGDDRRDRCVQSLLLQAAVAHEE